MRGPRKYHLSLGSNIEPEHNLAEAIRRLHQFGEVLNTSSVWESHAIGGRGPNFLNLCVSFVADVSAAELKRDIVDAIEAGMGRIRTSDKNAPRTIDIDIVMEGDSPVHPDRWNHAFVLLPMAELLPDVPHPVSGRRLADEASDAQASTWIRRRPDAVK